MFCDIKLPLGTSTDKSLEWPWNAGCCALRNCQLGGDCPTGGHEGPEGGMGGQSTAALRSIPANCIAMCIVLRERERGEVGGG